LNQRRVVLEPSLGPEHCTEYPPELVFVQATDLKFFATFTYRTGTQLALPFRSESNISKSLQDFRYHIEFQARLTSNDHSGE
jgi:hypothetical protein